MVDFKATKAVRKRGPVVVSVVGCSGSGKSVSALRLATGMQRVSGGKIIGIDTEGGRLSHYAPAEGEQPDPANFEFDFETIDLGPPFRPTRYLEAMLSAVGQGAGVIIVDSGSHAHEGAGGVLEWHDERQKKLAKEWKVSMDKANAAAWVEPKRDLQKLIVGIQQLPCHLVICLRAKEKIKPETGKGMKELGWMPIASDELTYEMHARMVLTPGSDGVPDWSLKRPGERAMVKSPHYFRALFKRWEGKQICEEMGEEMARWSSGAAPSEPERKPESGGPWRFPDGEHKGKTIAEAPTDYLTDLVAKARPSKRREEFEAEVLRRLKEETGG